MAFHAHLIFQPFSHCILAAQANFIFWVSKSWHCSSIYFHWRWWLHLDAYACRFLKKLRCIWTQMYLNSVKDCSALCPTAKDLNISITRKLIISILQTTSRPPNCSSHGLKTISRILNRKIKWKASTMPPQTNYS